MTGRVRAENIITSRLLVLQSQQLMLTYSQHLLEANRTDDLRKRVDRLERQVGRALASYRRVLLDLGSPQDANYWIVAYARLIEMGNALVVKLRDATADLPPQERYQLATDVESMELILEAWSKSMRRSMTAARLSA
jgi:hypothetical protein